MYKRQTLQWDNHYAGVEIDHDGLPPFSIATDHYVQGVVALKRGDTSKAQAALAAMGGETEINSTDRETMAPLLLRLALEGQMALAAGQGKEALELIGKAAELEGQLPAEYGPAVPVQPMAELLADTYLVLGETEKAQHYYELSLESAVGRERSLSGLSKASH